MLSKLIFSAIQQQLLKIAILVFLNLVDLIPIILWKDGESYVKFLGLTLLCYFAIVFSGISLFIAQPSLSFQISNRICSMVWSPGLRI